MYNMVYESRGPLNVGTAEFRRGISDSKLHALVTEHPVINVGSYRRERAAVVVEPAYYDELAHALDKLESLRAAVPMLMAAARAGVAVPSKTLVDLKIDLPDTGWEALNTFQADTPIRLTHDPDGSPVTRVVLDTSYIAELDEPLESTDD